MQRAVKTPLFNPLGLACGIVALFVVAAPASAQEGTTHPLDSALEMMNLKTQAGPMPDFVQQSRGSQDEDGYIPIGAKPPARSTKPKSAADVKALTAELDAARDAQLAGKRPKPMGSVAAAAKPAKAVKKPLNLQAGTTPATNR